MSFSQHIDRFSVELATSGQLIEKAQSLRHKVFTGYEGKDKDSFDSYCTHIVVIDKETDAVVGTYRLLLDSVAQKNDGFYAETKFNLTNIKNNCRRESLEMGRSCVDEAYRKYPIINLMWGQIISFMEKYNIRYLFGCPRINPTTPQGVGEILNFFKKHYFAPAQLRVSPLAKAKYDYDATTSSLSDREIMKLIPSLLKGYLKFGAAICGDPAHNKEFDSIIFFMILDSTKINTAFKNKILHAKGS